MELYNKYPELEVCRKDIETALSLMEDTYFSGGKILLCGNGGSAADCDHIAGELMKGFMCKREPDGEIKKGLAEKYPEDADYLASHLQRGISAISLCAHPALLSAVANDTAADMVYAQLVYGYGKKEDLLICLSTSGNSENVVNGAKVATAIGMKVISLTGGGESKLSLISDCTIRVPERETYLVQQLHLPVYHYLCGKLEKRIFGE